MGRKVLLPLLLLFILAGCGGGGSAAEEAETIAPAAPPAQAMEAVLPQAGAAADQLEMGGDMRASQVEAKARALTEEEILAAYEQAVEAYGWFDLDPLPAAGERVDMDGTVYYMVDAHGINDLEGLRGCLRNVFSEAVTERLLSTGGERPLYREIDGALYGRGSGREKNPYKGAVQIRTEQVSETAYSVDVMVDLLDDDQVTVTGVEYWSFPYAFEEGRWVFTEFNLVY